MRQIKFRAWNKRTNEWHNESNPSGLTYYGFHVFGECTLIDSPRCEDLQHLVLQQFTGLKDKNGKEIYEGDILMLDGDVVAPITFMDGAFQLIADSSQGRSPFIQERAKRYEIVGNIYMNPELLEAS